LSFFTLGGGIVCGTGMGVRSAASVLRLGRDLMGNLVLLVSFQSSARGLKGYMEVMRR
jgi:hypothetical protein